MKILPADNLNPETWDSFIKNQAGDAGFLQSWAWGEFQKSLGRKIFRVAVAADDAAGQEILAATLIVKQPLPLGKSYFYLPRGPVIKGDSKAEIFSFILAAIKKIAAQEKAIFLRLDPAWQKSPANEKILITNGFKNVGQVQPKQTLILHLAAAEKTISPIGAGSAAAAELLAKMKAKTRYNIKVAQKHGIAIDEGAKYFEDFWRLTQQTAKRDKFLAYDKTYYEKMLAALASLKLMVAKDKEKVIAANIMVDFGDWAVYLYGASDHDYREKMAPYLLQWEAIKAAEQSGKKAYDFWGVDEAKWPGVTRFKVGFAPETALTEYIGAWDAVYDKFWYKLYRLRR